MIENKQDYMNAITHTLDDENAELIYSIIVDQDISKKDIRDAAIVMRFDKLRKEMYDSTRTEIYWQLTADFNCSYKMVQRAVLSRRESKLRV